MTTPPFAQPEYVGSGYNTSEHNGHLVAYLPSEHRTGDKGIQTKFKPDPVDVVVATVACIDCEEEYQDAYIFAGRIIGVTKTRIGQIVLGRLRQVPSSFGNPAWELGPFTPADADKATAYWNSAPRTDSSNPPQHPPPPSPPRRLAAETGSSGTSPPSNSNSRSNCCNRATPLHTCTEPRRPMHPDRRAVSAPPSLPPTPPDGSISRSRSNDLLRRRAPFMERRLLCRSRTRRRLESARSEMGSIHRKRRAAPPSQPGNPHGVVRPRVHLRRGSRHRRRVQPPRDGRVRGPRR
jgi:hypothetical protein